MELTTITPSAWIFQSSPDRFNIDGYLAAHKQISWRAPQHHDQMGVGDPVYLWRNSGKSKGVAGIIAVAVISEGPVVRADEPNARQFWIDPTEGSVEEFRVSLNVLDVATSKGVIKSEWLQDDPICSDLPNLKMKQQTNYRLSAPHAERLARLWG